MATVTEGFVAATLDGAFLRVDSVESMVGTRHECRIVSKIEDATVFKTPRVSGPFYRPVDNTPPHNMLPVEIRREVILTGYGVKY